MLRIVLIGAGNHSESVHGPALAHYRDRHPGQAELAAVCDLRAERARLFCEKFGFARAYTDMDQMLEAERPGACWVVVPIEATREVAGRVMERGVPVIFEKPPGRDLAEAQALAELSRRTGTPNMVAFNRRWAPSTRQALSWAREHGPFDLIHGRMLRVDRRDEQFAFGTGIHLLDCVRALGAAAFGGMRWARGQRLRAASGALNFLVEIEFESGGRARCDILPTCGMLEESYTLYGRGRSISSELPWKAWPDIEVPGSATLWGEGKAEESHTYPADPMHLSAGFYGEAAEFIAALAERRRPSPSAEEAVESVALAEAVQEGREIRFAGG